MSEEDEAFRRLWPVYRSEVREATYPYPYGGHDVVLEEVWVRSGEPGEGVRVLDLSAGEGDLLSHFWAQGCLVTAMIHEGDQGLADRLMARFPGVSVIRGEGAGAPLARGGEPCDEGGVAPLPPLHGECESLGSFDVVVWSYDLREVCDGARFVEVVEEVFARYIQGKKGVMVVGCVSFEREEERLKYEKDSDRKRALVFEEVKGALIARRLRVQYTQLYPCAGLYKIRRR